MRQFCSQVKRVVSTLKLSQVKMGLKSRIFTTLILQTFLIISTNSESLDSAYFYISELEFAKDITALIVESTLKSKCDGNVFVVSEFCEQYLDHTLISIRDWAPPLLIVKSNFEFEKFPKNEIKSWTNYLAWHRRTCSLVFVCDLKAPRVWNNNGSLEYVDEIIGEPDQKDFGLGYFKFPHFLTSLDQILYFSEDQFTVEASDDALNFVSLQFSCINDRTKSIETELLKKVGVIVAIRVQFSNQFTESQMKVCSECEFCGKSKRQHYAYLGEWQRNKTHFGKFLGAFDEFRKSSFNHFNLRVGYFDYFPHFICPQITQNFSLEKLEKCLGIEWELLKQLGESLEFTFDLINIGNSIGSDDIRMTNFSTMITDLRQDRIDLAVGGITTTYERINVVDLTQVFQTEPIVFVVEKSKNIFVLGIWLAFQPVVWPIILLLIAIMSFLFQAITSDTVPCSCCLKTKSKKLSMSAIIDKALKEAKRKPLIVRMFESLELTLQPMLNQPLNSSQICQPRRFKMLLVLWWFSCLIITTLYNTSLITSLINPTIAKEPESLQELITEGYRFKLGGRHAAVHELINSTTTDDNTFKNSHGLDEESFKVSALLKIIKERLVSNEQVNPNLVAYIVDESGIGNGENNLKLSNMKVMKERLFITGYSFALKPQAHYKRKIDKALGQMNAGGLIQHWATKFVDKGQQFLERKFRIRERLGQINLNLKILQGAFIFLIFGLTFSSIIFCLEHWNRRYRFKMFNRKEIISMLKILLLFITRFYRNHVAEKTTDNKRKRQEKFRRVVDTVVKMRHEQNQNQTFLR